MQSDLASYRDHVYLTHKHKRSQEFVFATLLSFLPFPFPPFSLNYMAQDIWLAARS